MTNIHVVARDGSITLLSGRPGLSLMENLRDGGINDIAALCGGNCACATCHVYIEAASALPEKTEEEADMLGSLLHEKSNSRLSCQVKVADDMGDLRVQIAPEE